MGLWNRMNNVQCLPSSRRKLTKVKPPAVSWKLAIHVLLLWQPGNKVERDKSRSIFFVTTVWHGARCSRHVERATCTDFDLLARSSALLFYFSKVKDSSNVLGRLRTQPKLQFSQWKHRLYLSRRNSDIPIVTHERISNESTTCCLGRKRLVDRAVGSWLSRFDIWKRTMPTFSVKANVTCK